ncbi:MAG: OmpA family protein [Nannocystaceae bacterium]|nr:OmpA family protein [bacterium]
MSDEHGHDDGAHEIDKMPAGRLFGILTVLGSLTLGLCFAVIQLFNQQVRTIEQDRVSAGYATQQEYAAEMVEIAEGYGEYEIVEPGADDKPDTVTTRYFIPVGKASQQVIDNPALLAGKRPTPAFTGSGTGKKIDEWGGMPGAAARQPAKKPGNKPGDAKDAAKAKGPRDHRFAFTVSGDDLVLLGEVPSEAMSKAIEAAAKKTHFGDNVRNKLKVTEAPGKPAYEAAYERGLAAMDLMSTGAVKWTAGKLSVEGFVAAADKSKLDALTKAEGTPMGKVEVSTTEAADSCDKKLAKAARKLAFDPDGDKPGAAVSEKSGKSLDKLVAVAQECPGRIMIEGHTNDGGEAAADKQLSLQRANAVSAALQERGFPKARLRAKGYGGEQPVEPGNAKKNERIVVRIAR